MTFTVAGCSISGTKPTYKQTTYKSTNKARVLQENAKFVKRSPCPRYNVYTGCNKKGQRLDHTLSWVAERRGGAAYSKAGYRHVIYYDDINEPRGTGRSVLNKKPTASVTKNNKKAMAYYSPSDNSKKKPKFNVPQHTIELYKKYCNPNKVLTSDEKAMIAITGGDKGIPPSLIKGCKK